MRTSPQRSAGVLRVLILILFVFNLLALIFVPGSVLVKDITEFAQLAPYDHPLELPFRILICFAMSWIWVWEVGMEEVLLTLFFLICGICCAAILWWVKKKLDNVLMR